MDRKINGDTRPFANVESFLIDERFFEQSDPLKETMSAAISITGKRSDEDTHGMINVALVVMSNSHDHVRRKLTSHYLPCLSKQLLQ